jgi:MFS-type transporter involved in bile tolerance (Atg22 family)
VSLIYNERTKLTATLMNTVAAAVFITGVLAPLVAFSYDLPGPNKGVAAAVVSLIWILAALGIHLLARAQLGRLKP